MGFNLGAFGGALAKAGVDTYERLSEEDRRQAEYERKKKQWETEDAIQKVIAEGASQAGTGFGTEQAQAIDNPAGAKWRADPEFDAAVKQSAIDVGAENVQRARAAGALPEGMSVKTPEQARADTANRVRALDWKAGQQMEAGDLQLKKGKLEVTGLERQAAFDAKYDKTMDDLHKESATRLTDITTTAETSGMKGLAEKFGPELQKAFGAKVDLVGNNLIVKIPGQKPQTISSLSQATDALKGAAQLEFTHKLETRLVGSGMFRSPQEIVTYLQNKETNALKGREVAVKEAVAPSEIAKNNASAGASAAMSRLNNLSADNREKAAQLMSRWDTLTEAQQNGPEGMAIRHEFNMLNVKAGGTVPLAAKGSGSKGNVLQTPVDIKKNDDGTYTAFAKDGGHALYNTINGEAIPLGMDVSSYQAMKQAAKDNGVKLVSGEENGRLVLRYIGADGKPYEDPAKARYAKAPEAAGSAPGAKNAPQAAIAAPEGSPIARAAANRAANAARMQEAEAARRAQVQQAIDTSRRTTATTPQARFEVDRKTMSKAELQRRYGNGVGLTDEQYTYMMQ